VARNRLHENQRQGLSGVRSIARTAPLVGLMGTVIGILDSFSGAITKSAHVALVSDPIARALVMTALGMLVAVLAVWTSNWFTDRLRNLDAEMQFRRLQLVSHLQGLRRSGKLVSRRR
jgi:biopolymer transport protein ExbB